MRRLYLLVILWGCAASSPQELRREAQAVCKKITADLRTVHSREQLVKKLPELEKRFQQLADLLIAVKQYEKAHPDNFSEVAPSEEEANALEMLTELKRIYRIEGGRDLIEKAQHEPLIRLSTF